VSGFSTVRELLEQFAVDRDALYRALPSPFASGRPERLMEFYAEWQSAIDEVDFEKLGRDDRADAALFLNLLERERFDVQQTVQRQSEVSSLLPFLPVVNEIVVARRALTRPDPARAAGRLDEIRSSLDGLTGTLTSDNVTSCVTCERAARVALQIREALAEWFRFYDGYDPLFTWWVREPYKTLDAALESYASRLRANPTLQSDQSDKSDLRNVGGTSNESHQIVGNPIGKEALCAALERELIPYSPDELIEIGDREFEWCEREMRLAAADLGFGDEWRPALEHVKTLHVAPGEQPEMIRDLANEAVEFVAARDLVTVPPLCREIWRMGMMSPEAQKVNPFFLGGETILVSFPTDGMSQEQKRMSLRGNNRYFARATVQHELIPGHHLQLYMAERYRAHRRIFSTPFYIEGWTLHWEFLLWELGFARTPEERIGMLFWRMHRCARVAFSLRYHQGQMTADECVEMLVERVGHERDNALAEVRRSLGDDYPPLYQAAYLLGGLQMRALYRELVTSGQMTPRAFHDAVLKRNSIPIAVLRAELTGQSIPRNLSELNWRFYDES